MSRLGHTRLSNTAHPRDPIRKSSPEILKYLLGRVGRHQRDQDVIAPAIAVFLRWSPILQLNVLGLSIRYAVSDQRVGDVERHIPVHRRGE